MLVPLHHPQGVLLQILARDKPGSVLATTSLRPFGLDAADTQSLTLAQGVETQTHVLADGAPLVVLDRTGLAGDIAVQKFTERPLANEADAG